jgi:hypothetical protein
MIRDLLMAVAIAGTPAALTYAWILADQALATGGATVDQIIAEEAPR